MGADIFCRCLWFASSILSFRISYIIWRDQYRSTWYLNPWGEPKTFFEDWWRTLLALVTCAAIGMMELYFAMEKGWV